MHRVKTRTFVLGLLIAGLCQPWALLAAELTDVRVGVHSAYTRLVLEFDTSVGHQFSEEPGKLIVSVDGVDRIAPFVSRQLWPGNAILELVQLQHTRNHLTVHAYRRDDLIRIERYELSDPPRIVIDFHTMEYTAAENPDRRSEFHDETTDSSELEKSQADILARHGAIPSSSVGTDFADIPRTLGPTVGSPATTSGRTAMLAGLVERLRFWLEENRVLALVLLVAAFLLVDGLLINFYVLNRGKRRKRRLPNSMPAGPSESKPKPIDFAQLLTSLQSPGIARPPASADRLVESGTHRTGMQERVDTIIRFFTEAATGENDRGVERRVSTVEVRLQSLARASNIPKEMWVGEDGRRFQNRLRQADR